MKFISIFKIEAFAAFCMCSFAQCLCLLLIGMYASCFCAPSLLFFHMWQAVVFGRKVCVRDYHGIFLTIFAKNLSISGFWCLADGPLPAVVIIVVISPLAIWPLLSVAHIRHSLSDCF